MGTFLINWTFLALPSSETPHCNQLRVLSTVIFQMETCYFVGNPAYLASRGGMFNTRSCGGMGNPENWLPDIASRFSAENLAEAKVTKANFAGAASSWQIEAPPGNLS